MSIGYSRLIVYHSLEAEIIKLLTCFLFNTNIFLRLHIYLIKTRIQLSSYREHFHYNCPMFHLLPTLNLPGMSKISQAWASSPRKILSLPCAPPSISWAYGLQFSIHCLFGRKQKWKRMVDLSIESVRGVRRSQLIMGCHILSMLDAHFLSLWCTFTHAVYYLVF